MAGNNGSTNSDGRSSVGDSCHGNDQAAGHDNQSPGIGHGDQASGGVHGERAVISYVASVVCMCCVCCLWCVCVSGVYVCLVCDVCVCVTCLPAHYTSTVEAAPSEWVA